MKSDTPILSRRARFRFLLAPVLFAAVSGVAGAAGAQSAGPAGPPPTGAFPPPPPRYDGQAPPPFDYPFNDSPAGAGLADRGAEQGMSSARRFSFTAGIGPGLLIGPGENALAMSYQLFRVGLGLDPNLALMFGYSGVGTSSVNPGTREDSWLKQDVWSLGLQGYPDPRVYLRGGLGMGLVSESTKSASFSGGRGLAAEGAIGYELLQRRHVALALELNGTWTHYPRESWKTAGLQLSVSLF